MKESYEALKMDVINFAGEIWTEDGLNDPTVGDTVETSGEIIN